MNGRQSFFVIGINEDKIYRFLVFFILLINSIAFLFPVLRNDDPMLYANIVKNMTLSHNWISLVFDNKPWLDKPHFPFWITAISFKILGINSVAYILPGFLFNLIGGIYTYKLAQYLYNNKNIALFSLIIYLSSFHLLLSNSLDLRAEAYLLGEITPAIYYWLLYSQIYQNNSQASEHYILSSFRFLILGAIFTAMAMMTKGIFTLITIFSGVVTLAIHAKQFLKLFKLKWLIALVLSFILIAPEIISLYLQFDIHPNLVVFNKTDVSGVKWFFWGSQFGRFFNSGQIAVSHVQPFHYLFFVHTFLWAFLPWSLIFCYAIFLNIKGKNLKDKQNFIFLSGCFLPTFIIFSLTKFQLDHYTNILIPFAAIITAHTLFSLKSTAANILCKIQLGIATILLAASVILWYLIFDHVYFYFSFIALIIFSWILVHRKSAVLRSVFYSVTMIGAVFILVTNTLGNFDSKYDAGYNIALELNHEPKHIPAILYNANWVTFKFYYKGSYRQIDDLSGLINIKTPYYLVFNEEFLDKINMLGLKNTVYITTVKGNTIDKILPHVLNKTKNNLISYDVLKIN